MRRLISYLVTVAIILTTVSAECAAVIPTVSSTSPANGATAVAVNVTPSVVFSTAMTASSVTINSFYLLDPFGNPVTTGVPAKSNTNNNPTTFTITPSISLATCTTYTGKITTSVKSNSNPTANLANLCTFTFTTVTDSAAPTVTTVTPANGATGVNEASPGISITFNKLMTASTLSDPTSQFTVKDSLNNLVAGNITFSSTGNVTKATFTPTGNLASSGTYTVTVPTTAKSSCNVAMAAAKTWSFTVRDIAAPYITSTVPANSLTDIALSSPISVNFSEAMTTVTGSNITVKDGATTIAGTVTFDTISKLTATFTPTSNLDYSKTYTVTVTGASDAAGNTMAPNPYTFSFTTKANLQEYYCQTPPFVITTLAPNVLMILDNSQSMDEDFNGAAVGSYATASKSVIAKKALQDIVQKYSDTMRLGLMTYAQNSASKQYVSNSPYFVSYDPKSYCSTPPDECVDYCKTGNTTSKTACGTGCRAFADSAAFDETYMDEVITVRATGNALRNKYCDLVYPKTKRQQNLADTTKFIYYKQSLPLYSSSNPGNQFGYAASYTPTQEITNTSTGTDTYQTYTAKTGTSDSYGTTGTPGNGYGGTHTSPSYTLTDSDLALGYGNIGRRITSAYIGRTWFNNGSPGGGYLVKAIDTNDTVNTQKNQLLTQLTPYESTNGDSYMTTCTSSSSVTPSSCGYIINSGLTPTAGTLQTANDYFKGSSSPIQYSCQDNFIIYITDGLPSVNESGTTGSAATLLGADTTPATGTVLRKLDDLHAVAKTVGSSTSFNVKTYILGLGLTPQDKLMLEKMAVHGGTLNANYADNPTQLQSALDEIFNDILTRMSSGTAASILSNSEGSGANILQAVFYPKKLFLNGTDADWVGEMQNLWYFVDPNINNSTIREDTDGDMRLNLLNDYAARFSFDSTLKKTQVQLYQDTNGDGTGDVAIGGLIDTDEVKSLWRAGRQLWARNLATSPRTIKTTINGTSLINFSSANYPGGSVASNATALQPYLNITLAEAPTLIDYIHGVDPSPLGNYRSRTVQVSGTTSGVWRLGDIISSTPRVQSTVRLNSYNLLAPGGYNDNSYLTYINSNDYQSRGMVYVGANDGMLHAFNLGILSVKASGFQKASISGTDLGKEMWAFVPKNVLPYLQYIAGKSYQHMFTIDGKTLLSDASIGDNNTAPCVKATYWNCDKPRTGTLSSVVDSSNNLVTAKNTWRTVLIGGMGLGGASTKTCASGNNCVKTPLTDPADTTNNPGLGYSSYFALDVSDPNNPSLLWEFNNPSLGYTTSGPAIVRVGNREKNGRWFAVFGSGPAGPIDTTSHQFMAKSDQPLKFFVVDLRTGALVTTITPPTSIDNAFAGSMLGGAIDADRWDPTTTGNYQDDAIYVGYVKKKVSDGTWTDGGVGRIMIDQLADTTEPTDANVLNIWHWSPVVDGIGPVTTAIAKLQDKKNKKLWLFFGTGRYFYRDGATLDDKTSVRSLFGVKEPCYNTTGKPGNYLDQSCTAAQTGTLKPQTSSLLSAVADSDGGWRINLSAATTAEGAERVVTDTVALTNGTVFFTSYKPSTDICSYGGNSLLWGIKYNTGAMADCNALAGKVLIQLSTGEFKEVDVATSLGCPPPPGLVYPPDVTPPPRLPPRDPITPQPPQPIPIPMTGKPPSDAPPIISNSSNRPVKKILHIQEH